MPVPVAPVTPNPASRRSNAPTPLRRRQTATPTAPPRRRTLLNAALVFVAVVLVADALVGEKGFLVTVRARQDAQVEEAKLASLRQENARLREEKRRLNDDAATIEAEARRQLGLAQPGEIMFILKDIHPADRTRASSAR
ncbi:MAG: septum formation initiator family protein [Vicinamibacterales bacterium]